MAAGPVFADEPRRALIVSPFDDSIIPFNQLESGIRREMQSELSSRVEIYAEFLDLGQFPSAEYAARVASFLHDKYAGRHMDVVIAISPEALDFLLQRRDYLFADSQFMFAWVPQDQLTAFRVPSNVSGIVTRFNPAPTVDLALHLQPDATTMIMLSGTTDTDRHDLALEPERLKAFAHRIKILYWSNFVMADLLRAVGKLPRGTFLVDRGIIRDGAGQRLVGWQVDEKVTAAASVPVYSPFELLIGHGNVGGNVEDFETEGRQTGRLAVRLLNEHVVGLRIVAATSTIVDWRQLRRWGLSEANLPPGTIVRFRQPSLWDEHKWVVTGAAAALALQAFLIAALIVQARRRRRAQAALELQRRELAHLGRVSLLGELSGAIAHEISNPLTAILSNAQAGKRFLRREPSDTVQVDEIFDDIAADSKRAGNVIKRLRELYKKADAHLEPVDLNGIVADVLELADRRLFEDNVSVATKLATNLPAVRADPVQLKQVLLNLVVNACDAMADNKLSDRGLTIATSCDDKRFAQVTVSDRGSGIATGVAERLFQPFVTTKSTGIGLGLSISRSIIDAHGGRLSASNNSDRGATFSVALPIDEHSPHAVASRDPTDVPNEAPT